METLRRSAFVRHYEKGAFVHTSDNECLGMVFGSTIAGALYDATGSYLSTDAMILVLAVLSAAVSFGIDLCDRRMLKKRGRSTCVGAACPASPRSGKSSANSALCTVPTAAPP